MTQTGQGPRSAVAAPIATTIDAQAVEARPGGGSSRTGEPLEALVRRLLVLLGRLTGLESTYLTAIDWEAGAQDIVYARNDGMLQILEGLRVAWSDTLCRRALEGGPSCTSDVPGIYPDSSAARDLGIRTYVTVPVRDDSGETIGTLCRPSTRHPTPRPRMHLHRIRAWLPRQRLARVAVEPLATMVRGDEQRPLPVGFAARREHLVVRTAIDHPAHPPALLVLGRRALCVIPWI